MGIEIDLFFVRGSELTCFFCWGRKCWIDQVHGGSAHSLAHEERWVESQGAMRQYKER